MSKAIRYGAVELAEMIDASRAVRRRGWWSAYVRSSVYEGVVNEDGERGDSLAFYVVVEGENGERFASHRTFTTEAFRRDDAEARAERFLLTVADALRKGADPSRSSKWHRIEAMYGSAAWTPEDGLDAEAKARDIEAGSAEGDRFRRAVGL